jgi:hypothetical protein
VVKDGIILRFGSAGLFVAKMASQQLFYIGSASKHLLMQASRARN